jgi:hypothetical protein
MEYFLEVLRDVSLGLDLDPAYTVNLQLLSTIQVMGRFLPTETLTFCTVVLVPHWTVVPW